MDKDFIDDIFKKLKEDNYTAHDTIFPEGVTKISGARLSKFRALYVLGLPSTLESIDKGTFTSCNSLREIINHSSFDIAKYLNNKEYFFERAEKQVRIIKDISESNLKHEGDFLIYYDDRYEKTIPILVDYYGKIKEIAVPDGIMSIGDYGFINRKDLTLINLPDSLMEIGEEAFKESSIEIIDIPDQVCSIGKGAFKNAKNLKEVFIRNNLIFIDEEAFYGANIEKIFFFGTKEEWEKVLSKVGEDKIFSSNYKVLFIDDIIPD